MQYRAYYKNNAHLINRCFTYLYNIRSVYLLRARLVYFTTVIIIIINFFPAH